jgi:hypothetical protein
MFQQNIQYLCNGTITLSTSGSGTGLSSFVLTYVNRDISIGTPPPTASTTQLFINGFSYGEVISIMLLVFIFTAVFFKILKEWIFGMKTEGITNVKITSKK